MSTRSILAQPIKAEFDARGYVIRADESLLRLHVLAGGVQGGVLAIPTLAQLIDQSRRLKMRLSRAVRVADDDEDIELWAETEPFGDITRLSILGWYGLGGHLKQDVESAKAQELDGYSDGSFILHFDRALRLISSDGSLPEAFERDMFGKNFDTIFDLSVEQKERLRTAISAHKKFDEPTILVFGSDVTYSIDAQPVIGVDASFDGYVVTTQRSKDREVTSANPAEPAILFGQQLAPVLRQPLGRIIANAETIGSKLQGPIRENYALYAKDIADAARHLVALVDDLGDLEAVERPDFTTARDTIELGDVARRVAGLLALKAADHHIVIEAPTPGQAVTATAEFRRVLQILLNLVTNAIRYAPDGTRIDISIAEIGDMSEISVIDQGSGIATEDHEKVFAKFERLGRTGDGGSGLGLYISRRLARFMGGDLTIDAAENGGAKFTLRLPKT